MYNGFYFCIFVHLRLYEIKECGKTFRCDDLNCAFSKETQSYCLGQTKFEPQSIRNNGMNRLSCFRCDHDICDRYDKTLLNLDFDIITSIILNTNNNLFSCVHLQLRQKTFIRTDANRCFGYKSQQ